MEYAPLYALLAGALLLVGCPDNSAPPAPPPATSDPGVALAEPKAPEPANTNEVAALPEVTYYALSG